MKKDTKKAGLSTLLCKASAHPANTPSRLPAPVIDARPDSVQPATEHLAHPDRTPLRLRLPPISSWLNVRNILRGPHIPSPGRLDPKFRRLLDSSFPTLVTSQIRTIRAQLHSTST